MTFTTVPAAGSKLRASVLSSLITELRPVAAEKTGDTARTSTTQSADPDLSVALAIGTWDFIVRGFCSSAANNQGDINVRMAWTGTMTLNYSGMGLVDTLASGGSADLVASPTARGDTTSPGLSFAFGASTIGEMFALVGTATVTVAGNLTLEWGLLSASGTTNLLVGSKLTAERTA